MKLRPVRNVAQLPTYGFGPRAPLWWGTLGFMVIEGLGFVLAIGTYLYLQNQSDKWPLDPPPGLEFSSILTGLLLLSEIPNSWTKRAAKQQRLRQARIGVVIMALIGLVALALRWFEFTTLNTRWDSNAYGSIIWTLLGLHTAHLITDVGETCVMVPMLFVGPLDARRFVDVQENQDYWDFVVVTWIVIWGSVYWLPRWLGHG